MARQRRLNYSGFYHILNRGVERRDIFLDEEDHEYFLNLLHEYSTVYHFTIYSFCLMDNHYHLLLKTEDENLSVIMKTINARYSIYFNKKYKRVGPLWQGRFKSWYIYDEIYLSTLIRYIEHNPIKAKIVDKIGNFFWSMSSRHYDFPCLDYELINKIDIANELSCDEYAKIEKLYNLKIDIKNRTAISKKIHSLAYHFENLSREFAIVHAINDGYKQNEISKYLNLSEVAVSKIYKVYREKVNLFNKLKSKGIFWSYAKDATYIDVDENTLVEYVIKYGDFIDIKDAFRLFGKRVMKKVWEKDIKNDQRFIKLNLMIARIFFSMDVESNFFKGEKYARLEKLRLLTA